MKTLIQLTFMAFLLFIAITVGSAIVLKVFNFTWNKIYPKRIIGYQVQEMIRASDSLHYYDTVGTIYMEHGTIILVEKPYSQY